ncbi:MAG: carbohydrate-binding domain-containing protein [Lutisporaceae bacterium]
MRKNLRYYLSIITIVTTLLTGCGLSQDSQIGTTTVSTIASQVVVDKEFTARDLDVGYEESTATHIIFNGNDMNISGDGATSKDGVLTISDEGIYVITGTLKDGQIVVDAEDNDKVQIVLNGVSITSLDNAPIYIKNADKTFITLKEKTENTLTDGAQYAQTDDNNVDGVIFSKADLTINGDGTLNINGNYNYGIASKDDLIITGGTFNITAVKDALNGKDCVKIKDGIFNLSATTGNGIQSKNGDDTTKGYVYINGGDITISKSQEGIEGTAILIEDGKINIKAEDDGFNAATGKSDTTETSTTQLETNKTGTKQPGQPGQPGQSRPEGFGGGGGNSFEADANCYISITGGTIIVDASGDGIDSNGGLYISGGNIYVSGPTNSGNGGLDYNGTAEITGGTVVVSGSTGMAQGFSDSSSQYSILYNLTTACEAGTEVKLTDKDGKVVAAYTPNKQYQSVVISTPGLTKDKTYTLTCGSQTSEITLSSVVTSNGQQGMGGRGERGGQPGQDSMKKPEDGK